MAKDSNAPLDVVRRFLAAANAHQIDRALGYLSEDFVFREEGSDTGIGREGMRETLEWDRVIDSQARERSLQVAEGESAGEGDEIRVAGEFAERNRLYSALGVEETGCRLAFTVVGGRIAEQIIAQLPDDGPSFDEAVEPFLAWLAEHDPDAVETLLPDGELVFRADLAERWLELLERWKAERD